MLVSNTQHCACLQEDVTSASLPPAGSLLKLFSCFLKVKRKPEGIRFDLSVTRSSSSPIQAEALAVCGREGHRSDRILTADREVKTHRGGRPATAVSGRSLTAERHLHRSVGQMLFSLVHNSSKLYIRSVKHNGTTDNTTKSWVEAKNVSASSSLV